MSEELFEKLKDFIDEHSYYYYGNDEIGLFKKGIPFCQYNELIEFLEELKDKED